MLGRVGVDPQSYGPDVTRRIVFFNVAVNHVTRFRSEDDNCKGETLMMCYISFPLVQEKVVTNWHNVAVLKSGLQDYVLQHVSKGSVIILLNYSTSIVSELVCCVMDDWRHE